MLFWCFDCLAALRLEITSSRPALPLACPSPRDYVVRADFSFPRDRQLNNNRVDDE
jgi:hypothetical protein